MRGQQDGRQGQKNLNTLHGLSSHGTCRAGFLTGAGLAFAMIFIVFARPWRYPDQPDRPCTHI